MACPAGARLFWKSRGKSTRGLRPSGLPGTRGESVGRRTARAMWSLDAAACNCLGVWLLRFGFCGGSCSTFGAAQPLASPCQGEGDRRRRWKGGYVAESDIVTTGDMTYCFLLRSDRAVRNVSTPQSRLRRASPPWQGGPRGLSNPANKAKAATNQQRAPAPTKSNAQQPNTKTVAGGSMIRPTVRYDTRP